MVVHRSLRAAVRGEEVPIHGAADLDTTWADIGRARQLRGYVPRWPIEEGIACQWEWMRQTYA